VLGSGPPAPPRSIRFSPGSLIRCVLLGKGDKPAGNENPFTLVTSSDPKSLTNELEFPEFESSVLYRNTL
jgi:hypothetical protein